MSSVVLQNRYFFLLVGSLFPLFLVFKITSPLALANIPVIFVEGLVL